MATNGFTQTNMTANWCPNCGRRRGADGRCDGCDPWWSSPVVRYGGPLAVFIVLVLLGGVALTQPSKTSREVRSLPTNRIPDPVFASGSGFSPASPYQVASTPYRAAIPLPPPVITPPATVPNLAPSAAQIELVRIEELRQMTAYADSVVESTRQQRWQEARGGLAQVPVYSAAGSRRAQAELAPVAMY